MDDIDDPEATMTCPRCQSNLITTFRDNVEIDRCTRCRGVWLDAGELDRLLARAWAAFDDDDDAADWAERPEERAWRGRQDA